MADMRTLIALVTFSPTAFALGAGTCPDWDRVKLGGATGRRLEACIERCVKASDVKRMTSVFRTHEERDAWQSEFWGKWMHSAVPFALQTGDAGLRRMVTESAAEVMEAQMPNGYIGNYCVECQAGEGTWDVWGRKYTLLGLVHYYDLTRDKKALDAAARLVDHFMTQVGPGRRSLARTGSHRGLASCSILEPLVLLFDRTGEERYRAAAEYVVSEMCENPDGPELVRRASRDVAERFTKEEMAGVRHGSCAKAYEMLSCYQGLYAWYGVTGDRRYLDACLATARNVIDTEVNIVGGAALLEMWTRGKSIETKPWLGPMETCVTTTWMRFLETMLAETGDPLFADELERTWLNAFCGAMKEDCSTWSQYCPLDGSRGPGNLQCGMGTSCCIQNGPRGFLAVMRALVTGRDQGVDVNLYGESESTVKAAGGEVTVRQTTDYPRSGKVLLTVTCAGTVPEWTLRLREPGWLDGAPKWREVRRAWKSGDTYAVEFPMEARIVKKDDHLAILRGPVVLARTGRFGDGDVDDVISFGFDAKCPLVLRPVEASWAQQAYEVDLPFGLYTGDKKRRGVRAVRFCDWASAGADWNRSSTVRAWLPVALNPFGPRAAL